MERFESRNPATGEIEAVVDAHDPSAVEERLSTAAAAARDWRRTSVADRSRLIGKVGEILEADADVHARLISAEMGKLLSAARDEVLKCASTCRYYAENAESLLAIEPIEIEGETAYVRYDPLGVILAVMPWNFPYWQVLRFAAPTILAGNVGLLKHASNVPRCAMALQELFAQAGAPAGVFQTLLIGSDRVAGVIADARVAAVTLTGSEAAGASVASHAGKHIKKTVLELGGSDPFIVMPSAELDDAIATAVRARTINTGQSCIAAKRFIVHESVSSAFTSGFVAAMEALTVGTPVDPGTQLGPLSSDRQLDEVDDQVRRSVEMGARLLTGGRRIDRPGSFYEPTILTNIPDDAPARREEIFGPVASVFVVRSTDEAIEIANDTRFGLGASAWTADMKEADRFAHELEAGSVFINGMVASDPRVPFGGVKASGYGRELGSWGVREFTNVKTVRMRMQTPKAPQPAAE
jgi:succinate-semialdehyde dehydrogenase / glutarate-semialdehyde dehydrogenase